MRSRRHLTTLTCAATALLAALPAAASAAAGPPRLDVRAEQRTAGGRTPVSWFVVEGHPGRSTAVGRLLVSNPERRAVRVTIDAVRGETAQNLGSAYDLRAARPGGAAPWTRLSVRTLTIPPRSTRPVGVSLAVPAAAQAGEYLSGIAVEAGVADRRSPRKAKVALTRRLRFVVGLQANLPGPRRPHVTFDAVSVERYPSGVTFVARARNDGNMILTGVRGRMVVSRNGRTVLEQRLGPGAFVSHSVLRWGALAPREHPAEGTQYDVEAVLQYAGRTVRTTRAVSFGKRQAEVQEDYTPPSVAAAAPDAGPAPWMIGALAGGALAAVLAGLALLRLRRRRRPHSRSTAMKVLRAELATASEARPLSVIVVRPAAAADVATVAREMRARLRGPDVLCDLGAEGLLVIARDTGSRAAEGLAEDIGRLPVVRASGALVGVATAHAGTDVEALLAVARPAAPEPVPAG
jgi:hypothetical protein